MTTSFIGNIKGATHASAPASVKSNCCCFDLTSKDSLSTSSVSAWRAAEIRGIKSANFKVGLPKAVSLGDIVSCSGGQVRASGSLSSLLDTVCISSSIASNRINRSGSVRCCSETRSNRRLDSERRCYPTAERESVAAEEEAGSSGSELYLSGQATLNKLSHFLRELARQDCWAGLLEPFQGNLIPGNYSFQDWKLRDPSSSPASEDRIGSTMSAPASHMSPAPLHPASVPERERHPIPDKAATAESSSTRPSAFMSAPDLQFAGAGAAIASRSSHGYDDSVSYGAAVLNGSSRGNGSGSQVGISGASNAVWVVDKPQAELCRKSATCVTAEDIGSCENLALWLEERIGSSIISQWGNGVATKRVANLWCELVEGEISLEDNSPPKRTTHVASVQIRNEEGHTLVESYQQMADGRIRPRNRPLSEKMRPGEHVEEACLRGIFEELGGQLGARERVRMVPESYRREEEERESFSYPGLPTRYVIHTMVAHIEQLPSTEFSTEEDESGHGSAAEAMKSESSSPVGVKRHFWKWVPQSQLAECCRR